MTSKTLFAIPFLSLLLFWSCQKEPVSTIISKKDPPVSIIEIQACHLTTTWDSTAIRNKLLGKWNWEYIRCFWAPEKGNYDDFKGLSVEFKSDNTVEVFQNGMSAQKSTWQLVLLNDGNYKITTTPLLLQLPGRILFCAQRVVFMDSYVDGCDNYFVKAN